MRIVAFTTELHLGRARRVKEPNRRPPMRNSRQRGLVPWAEVSRIPAGNGLEAEVRWDLGRVGLCFGCPSSIHHGDGVDEMERKGSG